MRNIAALSCSLACAACMPTTNTIPAPTPSATGPSATTSSTPSSPVPLPPSGKLTSVASGTVPTTTGTAALAANANNAFAFDIFRNIRMHPGNVAYSPASISLALAMTYGGAKGATAEQMAKVLHIPIDSSAVHASWHQVLADWQHTGGHYELAVANKLFGQQGFAFEEPFLKMTATNYNAPLDQRDFAANAEAERRYINGWVENQTKSRIKNLIPQSGVSRDTRLVLANAIYFKAPWAKPFLKAATKDDDFFAASGKVKAKMMHGSLRAGYAKVNNLQLLDLPYKGGDFGMLLVLPNAKDGLDKVTASLNAEKYASWLTALHAGNVRVTMPRFKIDPANSMSLKKVLIDLGMPLAFDRRAADFTGMANPPNFGDRLHLGNVFHKAFVAVDEKGTEAAAATAAVMVLRSISGNKPHVFRADHPFLFLIHHRKTKTITFVGRVAEP